MEKPSPRPFTKPPEEINYVGAELELFAAAVNWKAYVRACLGPRLGRNVLEVGAGQGGTTKLLCRGDEDSWVCLEPDPGLVQRLKSEIEAGRLPSVCRAVGGTIESLDAEARFDSILYMDVLEHMEDDGAELARAAARLLPGGHLIVLSPAHQWLYTPFDEAIGHYRRYTKATLKALAPPGLALLESRYLDAAGLLASLGNRLLLRSSMPTASQIALWDGGLVPISKRIDRLLFYSIGKSVLTIWRRP